MIGICPSAIDIRKLDEPFRIALDALRDIVVVIGVPVDARANQHRPVYVVQIHFVEELFNPTPTLIIGDRRLIGPPGPCMCM